MAILRIGSVTIMDGGGGKNRLALVISDQHLVTIYGLRPLVYDVRPLSEPGPGDDPPAGPKRGAMRHAPPPGGARVSPSNPEPLRPFDGGALCRSGKYIGPDGARHRNFEHRSRLRGVLGGLHD
jgi:hypothetical protein